MKKLVKRILVVLLAGLLVFIVIYAWPRVPIITAFTAKGMCSSVFLAGKDPERVSAEDLSFFPISLAKAKINYEDKSVTATVFGLAKRKAVYREGLGAVLVLNIPEAELRGKSFRIPDPGYRQDTISWPMGDIVPDEKVEGLDYDHLEQVVNSAFDEPGSEAFFKTLSMAVVYDGQLVAEKYLDGYDRYTRFHGWSMTKSLTNAMVGILSGQGRMDIHESVDIPEWADDERSSITLGNLLQESSGLKWVENYFTISEATLMLMQSDNMVDFVKQRPLEHKPGEYYYYSSGDANLVSGLIRRSFGDDLEYYEFPYTALLHRAGMCNTTIETDGSGNFVASSYSYGTTRDWARFGMLYLNDGIFHGDTILPPGWVEYTRTPVSAKNSEGQFGAFFWLDHLESEAEINEGEKLETGEVLPADLYFSDGFLGQRIFIIPSKKLVVVRMGFSYKNLDLRQLLQDVLSALPE